MKRIKQIASFMLAVFVLAVLCVPAFAAGSVEYLGGAEKFIFMPGSEHSPEDLFGEDFKNVLPGDTLTTEIEVWNSLEKNSYIKLYFRALGQKSKENNAETGKDLDVSNSEYIEMDDFLSQLMISVDYSRIENPLFKIPADQAAPGGVDEWISLGVLYPGVSGVLTVNLEVPLSLETKYEEAIGYLDWEFLAEEVPFVNPKMGDDSSVALYVALAGISLAGCLLLAQKVSRKQI